MRPLLVFAICLAVVPSAGCALTSAAKEVADSGSETFKVDSRDYRDDSNSKDFGDEWGGVGKEARGATAREKEWDGLTKYMMSPKAMSIERNLGYGY